MTSCFSGRLFRRSSSNLRPYKLHNAEDNRRVGVVAESVASLKKQASNKFKVSPRDLRLVLEEDGTEVDSDEYLEILPQHAVLVAVTKEQNWKPPRHHLEGVLSSLQDVNKLRSLQESVEHLLQSKKGQPELLRLLGEVTKSIETDGRGHLETKQEDPAWFKDLGRFFHTKDQYMRENARRRIRSYLRTASDFIKRNQKLRPCHRHELTSILQWFADEMHKSDEYSDFFARASDFDDMRLCDTDGWFRCEGAYDCQRCIFQHHRINPYSSSNQRVLFSTWNLDHGVEKSREVLPQLIEAVVRKSHRTVNAAYFYDLLFTRFNLKLVHIECHDKTEHTTAKCDPQSIYL